MISIICKRYGEPPGCSGVQRQERVCTNNTLPAWSCQRSLPSSIITAAQLPLVP